MNTQDNRINSNSVAITKNMETPQERIQRIKKTKNIRKQRIQKKRNETVSKEQSQNIESSQLKLTRQQKSLIQKQKNRMAAQISRDRQKKYIQDLETRIIQLQSQVQKQICSKCRTPILSDTTKSQKSLSSEILQQDYYVQQELNNHIIQDESLPFQRDQSFASYNSIGNFLFICMIVIAVFSFSTSVDSTNQQMQAMSGRVLQAIAPLNQVIENDSLNQNNIQQSQTLRNSLIQYGKSDINQVKQSTENRCLYDYIQNHFLEEEDLDLSGGYQYSHYSNGRLLNCARPQLIMKKDTTDEDGSYFSGLFTIVLDNPQILEVASNSGVMYLDNVISLRGLYEIQVKFMNIKKIIGQNCLN